MSANDMTENESFIFAGEEDVIEPVEQEGESSVWRILIVDDEPEIHKITELALDNLVILDRKLEFLHAYSGEEAINVLRTESDIAVVLLDVVMETDDAGLIAVQKIRDDLNLHDVRIILRTGQPGYAPEEKVVIEYDINDYRTKTELTRNKLLTSVFSAIRTYAQILQSTQSRDFLDSLNQLNTQLLAQQDFPEFVECLVEHAKLLLGIEGDGLLLIDHPLVRDEVSNEGLWVAYGTGKFNTHIGEKYEHSLDGKIINLSKEVLQLEANIINEDVVAIYIRAQSCTSVLYYELTEPLDISSELIRTFVSSVTSDLDNSLLLEKISDIAYRDALTNLPNRTRFIQLLDHFASGRDKRNTAMLVDLDHFSDINDGLGQEVGNCLLLSVATRLQSQLGEEVTVARIGADIFGLIGDEQSLNPDDVLAIFNKALQAEEHVIPVNVSIGVCKRLDNNKSGLVVLKHANIALNKAKKDIRSRYKFYQPEMEDETSWRLGMIRRLTQDFSAGKLEVWYQPQINAQTGSIIGMESLLRWPDGEGGFISPVTFIPLAEYSGLIVDIGTWVIEQSCQELQKLYDMSYKNLRVAVNVSMPQFRNNDFVNVVIDTAKKFNIPPSLLELEITESVVMDDPKLVVTALEELKEAGFNIAIDDFGTGFSSLSYLQQLPLDRLKVDREFIKDIGEGGDGIIAQTVIQLGQRLGLETIAEGIETETQLQYIKDLGCNESQGYLHAKPMPAHELEQFLKDNCEQS